MFIKTNQQVENAGGAQDFLRRVASGVGLGHREGDGWQLGEEKSDVERESGENPIRARLLNPQLQELTYKLGLLVEAENKEEITFTAWESLGKHLLLALQAEGYGEPDDQGDEESGGDEEKDEEEETPAGGQNLPSQEDKTKVGEDDKNAPWNQTKQQ